MHQKLEFVYFNFKPDYPIDSVTVVKNSTFAELNANGIPNKLTNYFTWTERGKLNECVFKILDNQLRESEVFLNLHM
jgi:hypothetical protein